ncbi:hypothetical protein ACJ70E_08255 [Pseudomonas plecoglossicida]|uniref:hypothetical protein n=1 Tax=Pseudomonas plecoglossicida TaxID=70775 RepID=UPI003977B9F0
MDSGNVSAIIGAAAGIGGVLVGNFFVLTKEWWAQRQKRKRDAAYAGIILISHLDRFASECLEVACDDGTIQGQPAGEGGQCEIVKEVPTFKPLELDIDWRLLPKDLMYAIIRIPDQQEKLQGKLRAINEYDYDPPDHPEYFWHRQHGYSSLGVKVVKIIKRLAEVTGLPHEQPAPGEWNREEELKIVVARLDERERKAQGGEAYFVLRINHFLLVEISYIGTVKWFSISLHQRIKVLKCPV